MLLSVYWFTALISCSEPCTTGLDCNSNSTPNQISIFLGSSLFSGNAASTNNNPDETIIGLSGLGRNWSIDVSSNILLGIPELGLAMEFPYTDAQFQNENIVQSGTSAQSFGTSVSFIQGEQQSYTMISAPNYDVNIWKQGAVFVYQENNASPVQTILGSSNHEMFGDHIYSCGDLDGDSIEEALISSSFFGGSLDNETDPALAGRVYVINSQQWTVEQEQLSTDFTFFRGESTGSRLGHDAHCRHDVTGNGETDIVLAAPFADSGTFDASGAIYVLSSSSTTIEDALFRLQGQTSNAWLGWSIAVGDLDGDQLNDIAGGAPGDNGGLGAIYIWKGSDLVQNQTAPTIEFRTIDTQIGKEVHMTDINGDGLDDLIVGEPLGSLIEESQTFNNSGLAHIVLGRTDLSSLDGVQIIQESALHISIGQEEANFGSAILSGNLDDDGLQDMIFIHNATPQ